MKTMELVSRLKCYDKKANSRTLNIFVDFLIEYFRRTNIPCEQEYDFWNIDDSLPVLLLRAVTKLYESDEAWIVAYREHYKKDMEGDEIGDMISINSDDRFATLNLHKLVTILQNVTRDSGRVDYSILHAEASVLNLHFNQFLDKIFIQGGMHEIISKCDVKGMKGVFGQTDLLTWDGMGRLIMTFSREINDESHDVTFILDSNEDVQALGAGIQSCGTDVITVLTMIKDVSDNWDAQKLIADANITPFPEL